MPEPIQTTDEVTEETVEVTPKVDQEPVAPAPTADEALDTSTEESAEQASPEQQPQAPDYRQKFVDSQREAILLNERQKLAEARIEQLTKQDTPTDEAMRQLYPEWDNLDDYNKRVLVRQETIAMQQARTLAEQQEIKDRQRLDDELDSVIDTNPKLKGKESDFKRFARNPKNRGIPAETLAKAFLFDASDEDEPAPQQPVQRTEALPTGNGGPREPLKPKKISIEEAAEIRKTDNKRYMELVKSGQIEDDI